MRITDDMKRLPAGFNEAARDATPGEERTPAREAELRAASRSVVDSCALSFWSELGDVEQSVLHELVRSSNRRLPAPTAAEVGRELIGLHRKTGHAEWASPALRRLLAQGHAEVAGKRGRARTWSASETGRLLVDADMRASR